MPELIVNPREVQALLESKQGETAAYIGGLAQQVTDQAKIRANVDTGRMRASIVWQFLNDSEGVFARVGTDVFYAPFVHDGTGRYRGNPFLSDALSYVMERSG